MFKLLRYFSITSLISIAAASILLGVFYRQLAIGNLLEMGEDHNVDMTRAFANSLWPLVEPLVQASVNLSPEQIRALPDVRKLHDAVYNQAKGLSVAKIKVYNKRGIVVYSSEERQIGEDGRRNEGVRRALKGVVASELVYRDKFSGFEQTIEHSNLLSTYIPVHAPGTERIEAVFELYDNVTNQVERIKRTQLLVVAGLLVVFTLLYGVLYFIVRRADGILKRQDQEREQNERALRDSQAQLARTQYAVDRAADMVFWTDDQGRFIYANETSCRRLGYSPGQLLGLAVWDVDPNYPREAWSAVWERLKRDGRLRIETVQRTRSGELYPAEVHINYVTYGGAEFACAFARDITERKRAEADLIAAKEAAEAGSRVKAQFLATIGHEVRTPLNAILGMTEVTLMERGLTMEAREQLETVQRAAQELLAIISSVLDYAEIEAGRVAVAAAPFSLRRAVEAEARSGASLARSKGLEFDHAVAAGVPDELMGDAGRLRQVLGHLLENAVKFTPSGRVGLKVDAERVEGGVAEIHFAVEDTGIGIPADKREQVFGAFVQGDGSTTRKFGGTGLGLAICAHVVRLMDGRIWVEGDPGQGSTFHFTARFPVVSTAPA